MEFKELFEIFYTKFRGEENPPDNTDPEWQIAVRNYNDALQRLSNYDDTKWEFLYQTNQNAGTGDINTTIGQTNYTCPDDMYEIGGIVKVGTVEYPVIRTYQAQVQSIPTKYAYVTGDNQTGFTLTLNPAPTSAETLDYTYYRTPVRLDATTEDGTSIIEGGDPAFYYNSMLAQRFLDSRNFPAYQIAKKDAETALQNMRLKNNSGSYFSSWIMPDDGAGWGV